MYKQPSSTLFFLILLIKHHCTMKYLFTEQSFVWFVGCVETMEDDEWTGGGRRRCWLEYT